MRTIDITQILSPELKTRVRVNDLRLYVENTREDVVVIDFRNVKFATRSFIDEFYNVFLKTPDSLPIRIEITNVPEDIKRMFDSVSHTQTRVITIPPSVPEQFFKNADELIKYLRTATIG